MKKRNQHYVFQAYLRKWNNKEKKLWCLENGKIDARDTIEVAQEEDFYRISKLNNDEVKFLNFFWSKQPLDIQKQLMSHLHQYQISFIWEKELTLCKAMVYDIKTTGSITKEANDELLALTEYLHNCLKNASNECDNKGKSEKNLWQNEIDNLHKILLIARGIANNKDNGEIIAKLISEFDETMKLLEEKVDEATNDIEEDFLSSIESETSRWMRAFKKRNFSEIEKKDKRELFLHIAIHYFRTKATRDRFQKKLNAQFSNKAFIEEFCKLQPSINLANVHVENITHPIFWGFQAALSTSLFTRKACITFLENKTNMPFITSDQPIINLKADYAKSNHENLQPCEVKELLLYYPLSPRIAITIDANTSSEKIETVNLQTQDVEEYNDKMVKASHEIIFANEKGILEKINEGKKNEDVVV